MATLSTCSRSRCARARLEKNHAAEKKINRRPRRIFFFARSQRVMDAMYTMIENKVGSLMVKDDGGIALSRTFKTQKYTF